MGKLKVIVLKMEVGTDLESYPPLDSGCLPFNSIDKSGLVGCN